MLHVIQQNAPALVDAFKGQRSALESVVATPGDQDSILRFMALLGELDPAAPRSDALTEGLTAALSGPLDVPDIQDFAQRSLCAELAALKPNGQGDVALSEDAQILITALLHHCCNCSVPLEPVLVRLRRGLLELAEAGQSPNAAQLQLAEALARHSFTNEHIWAQTAAEARVVADLVLTVVDQITQGANVSAFTLFVIGAYQPLDGIEAVRDWVMRLGVQTPDALDPTLRLLVFDRLLEDATEIEALTVDAGEVSTKVRQQYEENPYPRWRHLPLLAEHADLRSYVAAHLPFGGKLPQDDVPEPRVLIAGAGTGRHPIEVARALPSAAVLAIDLSRASLAYGAREARARGVTNISFAQADILRLADVPVTFDLIESVGVLHHMHDPEAGLRSLVKLLRPGGVMRLGLYSQTARHGLNAVRDRYRGPNADATLTDIRARRQEVLASDDPALMALLGAPDFHSTSMFRDAVMHVQEHQFTLLDLDKMLKRNGLKFLGFSNTTAHAVLQKLPPKQARKRATDLKAWHRYEQRHPETFVGMHQFFCMKSADGSRVQA